MDIYGNERYVCCEDCECMISAEDAAPDNLCFECFADRLIDSTEDSDVRGFISHNRYDFISYLRGAVYDY